MEASQRRTLALLLLGVLAGAPLPGAARAARGAALAAAVPQRPPAPAAGEPAPGRLLVAASKQAGPFFAQSVVVLLEYGPSGSLGLVVNRPTPVRLAHLLPQEPALAARDDTVWLGGPVGRATVWVLFRGEPPPLPEGEPPPLPEGEPPALPEGEAPPEPEAGGPPRPEGGPDPAPEPRAAPSQALLADVRATRSPETLHALLEAGAPASGLRVYAGYAGWGPGQLEGEIARGDWHVVDGAAEWIFERPAAEVWPALVRRSEGIRVRAPGPGRAQRTATTYAIQAGSSGAWSRRVNTPLPSLVLRSVPSQ